MSNIQKNTPPSIDGHKTDTSNKNNKRTEIAINKLRIGNLQKMGKIAVREIFAFSTVLSITWLGLIVYKHWANMGKSIYIEL